MLILKQIHSNVFFELFSFFKYVIIKDVIVQKFLIYDVI